MDLWHWAHAHYRMGHNDRANHATPQMVFDSGVQGVGGREDSLFLKRMVPYGLPAGIKWAGWYRADHER